MGIIDEIKATHEEFTKIRRDIHAHPELGYQEVRTSGIVADLLEEWGIEVHRGLGITGVVGVLKGTKGNSKRAIGIRADMDALPMPEHNRFAHISTIPGKMHGCGHDGHTTILLMAAKYLARNRDFDGTINFIFQPAEEGGAGAKAMMDDGLFTKFPCDEIYGLHNRPTMPLGELGFRKGPTMASTSKFEITIKGVGGHASTPHLTVDPVIIGSEMVSALQTVVSRHKHPNNTAVLSITQFHAGDAFNVIPERAILRGTVRTFDMDVVKEIEANMRRIVEILPKMHGGSGELEFSTETPVLNNWDEPTDFAIAVAKETFGDKMVNEAFPRRNGGEDFAFFLEEVPGNYCFLGAGYGDHLGYSYEGMGPCETHNPNYDFNDAILPIGATFWVRLAQAFFKR